MFKIPERIKTIKPHFPKYWLLFFYILSLSYFELIYRLWSFKNISIDFIFPILFSLSAGSLLCLITTFFTILFQRIIALLLISFISIVYITQILYYQIFHMPLCLYSLSGTSDALQFGDIIVTTILFNLFVLILLSLPYILLLLMDLKLDYHKTNRFVLSITACFTIASYGISLICVNLTGDSPVSQYTQYYKMSSLELSINKLGLMTSMGLDLKGLFFGFDDNNDNNLTTVTAMSLNTTYKTHPKSKTNYYTDTYNTFDEPKGFNVMDIDFEHLIETEKDQTLLDMHHYFSAVPPSEKNDFTGLFKGNNLIFITAEAFSSYAIDQTLTPTLFKMTHSGFVFKNFYNPVWGVSTSDGEYVACTGLIPKSGIWSFSRSGANYLPFAMGNQFKNLGYQTKAYHNHTYSYYDRHISHPNMGYNYKGLGNGLEITETWPESDLEMIEMTYPEFISSEPFHTYFMTVSGHLRYSFTGNYIAGKNKALVESLPYSEGPKSYLACNMELDMALELLIKKLDAADILDNTVIVLSPDHYPYGLSSSDMEELAGHEIEGNFELYKSTLIIWKNGMAPIVIDKPCSSLDIIPTLSNLFGLEYDSRLLMGNDILSSNTPLVIFSNRSWMTDRATYNTTTHTVTFLDGTQSDDDYIHIINQWVDSKFRFSKEILEENYYKKIFPTTEGPFSD